MARVTFEKGAKLARMEFKLTNPERVLKQIGALMVAESQAAFKNQQFGGEVWPARSSVNVFGIINDFATGRKAPPARRFETRPALRDTGRLSASISFRLIGTNAVEVGTNLPYAALHNFGGTSESKPLTRDVRTRLWGWLKKQNLEMRRRLGWVLNSKFKDKTLKAEVPARRFIGITNQTRDHVRKAIGVHITEAKS